MSSFHVSNNAWSRLFAFSTYIDHKLAVLIRGARLAYMSWDLHKNYLNAYQQLRRAALQPPCHLALFLACLRWPW